jgi:hypothetical protein
MRGASTISRSHAILVKNPSNSLLPSRGASSEGQMAKRTILVSDLTGKEIDERNGAQVVIRYADARRGQVVLDVNASEVEDLASKGQRQARRGRRPKSSTNG